MSLSLTHFAESLFAAMANESRESVLAACGLTTVADPELVKGADQMAFCHVGLESFSGKSFDRASQVDVVFRVRDGLAVAFELKLGRTRLDKTRVDEEWLRPCETSHGGRRWRGNMMAILDRRFPGPPPDDLAVQVKSGRLVLLREWVVVARQETLESWRMTPPEFGSHVAQVSFESVIEAFGGKIAFNDLVRRQLDIDYFDKWVAPMGRDRLT